MTKTEKLINGTNYNDCMQNPTSDRPEDVYNDLKGKLAYINSAGNSHYGRIREIDLTNGLIIIDEHPRFDYEKQKVVRCNGVIVHFQNPVIAEISIGEFEHVVKSLGWEMSYLNSWVRIGDSFGRLNRIYSYGYELTPFLNNAAGEYFFMKSPPLCVPRGEKPQAIIPVRKKDLETLIKDNKQMKKIEKLQRENALRKLKI